MISGLPEFGSFFVFFRLTNAVESPMMSVETRFTMGSPLDLPFVLQEGDFLKMVFDKVKAILIDQLDVEESTVTLEANIIDDLGADSLDIVDLVMSFEDEFDTEIPDEEIEGLRTVGEIVKFIEERVEG